MQIFEFTVLPHRALCLCNLSALLGALKLLFPPNYWGFLNQSEKESEVLPV